MATIINTGIDFNTVMGTAYKALTTGDAASAVKAAGTHVKAANLHACVVLFMQGEGAHMAVDAAQQAAAIRAKALLEKQGIDVDSAAAVREALRPAFWSAEGNDGTPMKHLDKATAEALLEAAKTDAAKAKVQASIDAQNEVLARAYNRCAQNAQRMANRIIGREAPEKAKVRVPAAVQSAIDALLAQHDPKVLREAIKRATSK